MHTQGGGGGGGGGGEGGGGGRGEGERGRGEGGEGEGEGGGGRGRGEGRSLEHIKRRKYSSCMTIAAANDIISQVGVRGREGGRADLEERDGKTVKLSSLELHPQ